MNAGQPIQASADPYGKAQRAQQDCVLGGKVSLPILSDQTNRIYGLINALENEVDVIGGFADRLVANGANQKNSPPTETAVPSSHDWILRDIGNRLDKLLERTSTLSQRLNESI